MKNQKSTLFLIKFIGIIALYYLIISLFGTDYLGPYMTMTAKLSALLLNIFEDGVRASGQFINGNMCSLNLSYGCDGTDQFIVFVSGVISFPAISKYKLKGLLYGLPLLYFLNLFRIIGLYYVNLNSPENFELFHETIFPTIFIFISIAFWIYWLKRSNLASNS